MSARLCCPLEAAIAARLKAEAEAADLAAYQAEQGMDGMVRRLLELPIEKGPPRHLSNHFSLHFLGGEGRPC